MKRIISIGTALVALCLLMASCNEPAKPRIGIAGISIECSTFSPATTTIDMFRIARGEEVLKGYPFFRDNDSILNRAQWLPAMVANATPGGTVTRETFEALTEEILERLRANLPYDGLFFDIHGAMSVEGLDDPEGVLLTRVREVVGPKTIVSTCMDLHGCVSHTLAHLSDLITCFRMAPHEDRWESKLRAVTNLLERLENHTGKPAYKAWVKVPILLPGEQTSTRIDPGKKLYAQVPVVAAREGVIDAAIWISYAWADEPRNHGVVMVVGDDKDAVETGALELAQFFWDVRNEFAFVAPTASLETCLEAALKSTKKPYFISDMGDNPTAGGAGDVTWTLTKLLERKEFKKANGPVLMYASIPGPEVVAQAVAVGVGGHVEGLVGAKVDYRYAPPVKISGTVEHIAATQTEVVVRQGSLRIIVTTQRKPYHFESDFQAVGLEPTKADIVMVKLGYLTEGLYPLQADWMMALTRGGVDQDLKALPYQRIPRPMFPIDPEMALNDAPYQPVVEFIE